MAILKADAADASQFSGMWPNGHKIVADRNGEKLVQNYKRHQIAPVGEPSTAGGRLEMYATWCRR
jgi:hypothetical protein